MSGKRQNMNGFERKRAKQAERRRAHDDKYADKHARDRLAALAEHFASEERTNERR
ncbi:hypothetical protein [Nocardioides sp. SYSU D00038]|uniref:hypothetical protein n=1 Tax=Nocardioides sp. SYSU D00038 TaxID=2812554 RepID=UPI0019679DF8|nr:hypothetical protein [Nocardioides sp. SYSU D00038]